MKKIIRACTVSQSIGFVRGMLPDLMKKYEVVLLSSPGKEMDEATETYGVRGFKINMERHISLWKDLVSLWKLIGAFRKERPDMVHSMTPKAGMLCMVAACITRVPLRIHTFTGLVFPTSTGLKRRILMFTDWLTCACATHIIPEGEGVKNDLLNHHITRKPLQVLGYGNVRGVDMEYYSIENLKLRIANYPREKKEQIKEVLKKTPLFTFLFVGRIVRDKGINELCSAFRRIHIQYPQTRLWLVGAFEESLDPVSPETKALIADEKNGIEAVGVKRGDDLLAFYAASDCFVFPSYREGFPNTVLEAGAMGLPSIVTDINGSREIIEEGKNGLIILSKDEQALYEAMKTMVVDSVSREQMASNARPMIADRFEQGYVRQCLYNFYDQVFS